MSALRCKCCCKHKQRGYCYTMYYIRGTTLFAITLLTIATSLAATPALILTPLIKENKWEQAREASTVNSKDFLNITSYSGFLTVDERYNSNLFFWYFPATEKRVWEVPESKEKQGQTPWIIWLQGGPGATSLAGLFDEMGPFEYDTSSKTLKKRKFSWCAEYSMVFIDNPVGAGFSFTDSEEGFAQNMEMYADSLYNAVKQLVQVYPELNKAQLYLAGESYAGLYVPALAMKILDGRDETKNSINLKGLILGNPVLDRSNIVDYTRVFYNWGLVDAQGASAAKPLQDQYQQAIHKGDAKAAYDLREELLDKLQDIAYKGQLYNVLQDTGGLQDFVPFITRPDVRESLHVGDLTFTFSNGTVHQKLLPDFLSTVSSKIEILLENYKILIYCGQLDLTSPCVLNAEARRKNWRWSGRDKFLAAPRVPLWFNNTFAGYAKAGGNFTEILVSGAGHLVPIDKPAQAQQIVTNFIRGQDFPVPAHYKLMKHDPKYQEYMDLQTSEILSNSSGLTNGLIASVVLNVLLLIGIVIGGVMTMRWRREYNNYFNLPFSDDILTLA
ncbi:venom serine carboxypeptidase-like [Maniola jurtina]|uniref:venom serine carboxypeptidase-like n=1 Tax=Maniola jurtina TaxID=191418 RepID=UPI001E68AB34|nr:venom serine carboxypeptidase-like [Maniola jurtina]